VVLVLSADPTRDIRNTRAITFVVKRGKAIEVSQANPPRG
jgi:hypothetical protein